MIFVYKYVIRITSQFSSLVLVFTVFLRPKPSPKEKIKIFDRKQGCEFQSRYIQASHHYYQLIQHIIVQSSSNQRLHLSPKNPICFPS